MNAINAIIADPHPIYLDGLRCLIRKEKNIAIVGTASNGQDLMQLISETFTDIVLVDISISLHSGIDITRKIKFEHPTIEVIALSSCSDETTIVHAISAGAKGYLLKSAGQLEVLQAIKCVSAGKPFFCNATTTALTSEIIKDKSLRPALPPIILSEFEQNVIRLICKDLTSKEIASELGISVRTVDGCRIRILRKLQVSGPAGIGIFATKNNLL